ncbi:MAG: CYTH domain-containing protein [Nitrospirae bacterium]|nr:CYTH domain-containing protein [Nitrospirota bacterium]
MIIKEKERKLLVSSAQGEQIVEKLKQLNTTGDFVLQDDKALSIQDAYLDDRNFLLAKKNGYLRLRGKLSGHMIVLRTIINNELDEISHPVSDEGLKLVLSLLKEHYGINKDPNFILPNISEIFQSVGLNEVLRTAIERFERNVYMDNIHIGKMKIDAFRYISPNEMGPFYEVELNSYNKVFHKEMDNFASEILKEFQHSIEPSILSKYLRGVNISYGLNIK